MEVYKIHMCIVCEADFDTTVEADIEIAILNKIGIFGNFSFKCKLMLNIIIYYATSEDDLDEVGVQPLS